MPFITETVTSQLETNLAREWLIAKDYLLDDHTPPITAPQDAMWINSVISFSNAVDNQVRIYVQNGVGGADILAIIPPGTSTILFTDALPYSVDRSSFISSFDTVANYHAVGGRDLYFSTSGAGGDVLPDWIRFDSVWDYEHQVGRDPNPDASQPYTMSTPGAPEEVSPWTAPPIIDWTADNELFISTIAFAGYDNDIEAPYHAISIYERDVVPPGDITGEYLGADRRFMGF